MSNTKYTERTYQINEVAAFRKTAEIFGGLSNMAPNYPIKINGLTILTTEALYQACRFPHMPEIQERILKERSPMTAKMIGKPFRNQSRPDFEQVKVDIMRWCLRIKLAQNFITFGKLLESTGNLPIVEDSHKDPFWGAMRDKSEPSMLKGVNALGRLLMELRQHYFDNRYSYKTFYISSLQINNFKLLGNNITDIDERNSFVSYISHQIHISDNNTNLLPVTQNSSTDSYIIPSSEVEARDFVELPTNKKPSRKPSVSTNQKSAIISPGKKASKSSKPKKLPESFPLFSNESN